jgi:hypothetical protein
VRDKVNVLLAKDFQPSFSLTGRKDPRGGATSLAKKCFMDLLGPLIIGNLFNCSNLMLFMFLFICINIAESSSESAEKVKLCLKHYLKNAPSRSVAKTPDVLQPQEKRRKLFESSDSE